MYRHLQKCLYKGLCPKLSTNAPMVKLVEERKVSVWSRASEVKFGRHLVKLLHFYNLTAKTKSIKANSSDRVTISVEHRGLKG